MDNRELIIANAGSIARLLAGIIGGIMASAGMQSDDGALQASIGAAIVAATGLWAIIKNARAKKG